MNLYRFLFLYFFLSLSPLCTAQNEFVENSGDVIQLSLPTLAIGKLIYDKDFKGMKEFALSFSITVVTTQVLKRTTKKRRPNGEHFGFPSGHTSSSFQASTFILKKYGPKYGIPAMLAASYVGYTRTHGELPRHDWIDVLAGAAIGSLSSWLTTSKKINADKAEIRYGLSTISEQAEIYIDLRF